MIYLISRSDEGKIIDYRVVEGDQKDVQAYIENLGRGWKMVEVDVLHIDKGNINMRRMIIQPEDFE